MPAQLSQTQQQQIQDLSIQAYRIAKCQGLARVDFLMSEEGTLFINEINTLPGFTPISLYPKMWDHMGIDFSSLLDTLINFALQQAN